LLLALRRLRRCERNRPDAASLKRRLLGAPRAGVFPCPKRSAEPSEGRHSSKQSTRAQKDGYYNGKEVDQGIARKAQQEPEGEMEGTETAAAAEATQALA
jgi:hypothetical protein